MARFPVSLVTCIVMTSLVALNSDGKGGDFQPDCTQDPYGWIRHPADCRSYFRCVYGVATKMPSCLQGLVFSMKALTCVWPQSSWDDCSVAVNPPPPTPTPQPLTVEQRCQQDQTALFPHSTECQLYYDCSNQEEPGMYSRFTKHMEECTYPQLFNSQTLRCENYTDVDCGQRQEHVEPCAYLRNQCVLSHCQPCSTRAESANCSGLLDGMNVHREKLWTPFYTVCKDQRTVGFGRCPQDSVLSMPQFFSPDLGRCASLYEIPTEHGGYYLNCTGRSDGLYPDDMTSRTDLYFRCKKGQLTSIDLCPTGTVFQTSSSQCVDPVNPPPPTPAPQPLTVEQRCQQDQTALFPHPTECQLYYNCSNQEDPGYHSSFTKHMEECTYPQLFNSQTLRCENYTNVDCGQRQEHVEPCAYLRNQCGTAHCQPCSTRAESASCSGLLDGMNVHKERLWTPFYTVCKDQRTVDSGMCPQDAVLNVPQFFSPDLGRCASLYEIPTEHGGYYLNCTGRSDGLYPDDMTSRTDLYFRCKKGQLTSIDLCPAGTVFQTSSSQCVDPDSLP